MYGPGSTSTTSTPNCSTSKASDSAQPSTAHFDDDVDRVARLADESGLARDDDDAARPLLAERRQQRARQRHDAEEVGFHHAAHLGVGNVLEGAARRDAGVMHDRIEEAAGDGQRLGDAFADRSRIRHVELHDVDVPAPRPTAPAPLRAAPLRSRLRIVAMTRQPRFASSTVASRPNPADVPVIRTVRIRAPLLPPAVCRAARRVGRFVRYMRPVYPLRCDNGERIAQMPLRR